MDGRSVNRLKFRRSALSAMALMMGSGAMLAAAAMLILPADARAQAMGKVSLDSGPVAPEGIAPAPAADAKVAEPTPTAPVPEAKATGPESSSDKKPEKPIDIAPSPVPAPSAPPAAAPQITASAAVPQAAALPLSGQMLDIRIAGEGYFRVQSAKGAEGGVFFTRTGKFIIDEFGHICLADGGLIIDPVITVPSHLTAIEFSADGVVTGNEAGDADPITFGRVQLAVFTKPSALQHVEGTLFKATADSGAGRLENPETPGVGALKQGELETVEETLRMQSARMQIAAAAPKPAEPAAPAPEKSKPTTASIENEPIAPARAHASDTSDASKPLANGANAAKTTTDGTSSGWYSQFKGLGQVVAAMAVVIGLIFILKGLAKKFVPGAKAAGAKGVIEILARHPISKNQAIVLVRIGSQIVALNQGKEKSESVLVIHDPTEVAKIIGQIEGKKSHSSQAGFTKLLANARVDLEAAPDAEPELASMSPENLDEQLEEMAAAKRQLMELRQHVRTVRDRLPKG